MREILFRGKSVVDGKWIFGDFCNYNGTTHIKNKYDLFNVVIPETIGQFTGLTDKNGTKIFEGDILSFGFQPFVVKWDNENGKYMLFNYHGSKRDGFNVDTMQLIEVIGNIYDNPELLKGE